MDPIIIKCFTCEKEIQMSSGIYDGQGIPNYGFTVCKNCYKGNWDGWSPALESKILAYLKKEGINPPNRNKKGLLPRD